MTVRCHGFWRETSVRLLASVAWRSDLPIDPNSFIRKTPPVNFCLSLQIQLQLGLILLVAVSAGAQSRPGETGSDAARRQNREANEQNQREINRAGDAYAPNGSSSDALLRQYQNQWRQQAEQEKANREAAAQAAQAARERAEFLKAEQQRIANVRADRIAYRIENAMTLAMIDLTYPNPDGGDLTHLTFFSLWFSQEGSRPQTWKFLGQYGPGNRFEVAMAALERAYALGDRTAPWLAAVLEGEMAWGGPPGVTWWLLLKANERQADLSADDILHRDWNLRRTIDWRDAQLQNFPGNLLRIKNPKEPDCDFRSAAAVENLGGELQDVVINELKEHTYYALLRVRKDGELIEIDSRPSDAIAVAVTCDPALPIYVSEEVLNDVLGE